MRSIRSMTGSERRFLAYVVALCIITLSGVLGLSDAALAALVTLTATYVGQGAMKEAVMYGRK